MNILSDSKYEQLTEIIIGAAYQVHSTLGSGFLEKVYENALYEELAERSLSIERQKPLTVHYKGKLVGEFISDLIVEDVVILELKATERISDIFEIQLKNYLKATGIEVGLLINFGRSVEVRRKFVPRTLNTIVC